MLKNTKGEIYVFICVFVLVIMTVFSVIFTYASIITDVKVQKTNTEIVFVGIMFLHKVQRKISERII